MADRARLLAAAKALSAQDSRVSLCESFVVGLDVQRAAISMLGDPFGVETVCASDSEAARLEELQLDLGEGPTWQALADEAPVAVPNIQAPDAPRWPILAEALRDASVRSIYAFPMTVGPLRVGAVNLYSDVENALAEEVLPEAAALASLAAREVLRRSLAQLADVEDGVGRSEFFSRREIHQAAGMVVAQLGLPPDDALLIMRAHAFATHRTLRELAASVVARRVTFGPGL
jgi:hypothetical protein